MQRCMYLRVYLIGRFSSRTVLVSYGIFLINIIIFQDLSICIPAKSRESVK